MSDRRVFGVNLRGDGRWSMWTCFLRDERHVTPGTFKELSIHDKEQEAQAAANAEREKYQLPKEPA